MQSYRTLVLSAATFLFLPPQAQAQLLGTAPEPNQAGLRVRESVSRNAMGAPPSASQNGSRWYGWQTLAVDGAVAISLVAAFEMSRIDARKSAEGLGTLAVVGYLFGGPAVHAAHRRGFAALGSFWLRVLTPLAGVSIGVSSARHDKLRGGIIGVFGGMGAAAAFDSTVLSYSHNQVARSWAPVAVFVPGFTWVGLGREF